MFPNTTVTGGIRMRATAVRTCEFLVDCTVFVYGPVEQCTTWSTLSARQQQHRCPASKPLPDERRGKRREGCARSVAEEDSLAKRRATQQQQLKCGRLQAAFAGLAFFTGSSGSDARSALRISPAKYVP